MGKNFTNSPALNFINAPEEQAETPTVKKSDKLRTVTIPKGMKFELTEKKSKRVQLIMQPSLYEKAKAKADRLGISFNEYVHAIIDNDVNSEE